MDLIDDIESDIAIAFLVERKYDQRMDTRQARELIGNVIAELKRTSRPFKHVKCVTSTETHLRHPSH